MTRRLYHATERHECGHDKRREQAWASWDELYALQGVIPVHVWEFPRTALGIGDKRPLPYMRDILKVALDQALDEDIVFLTNDDVVLHSGLVEALQYHCSIWGPCSSQRLDFRGRAVPPFSAPPAHVIREGRRHIGRDLFAAPKAWWTEYCEWFGDPLLGASMWDLHAACAMRKFYGINSTRQNLADHIFPAELELGYVSHRVHPAPWSNPRNDGKTPSEIWNRRNFREWAGIHLPDLRFAPNGAI